MSIESLPPSTIAPKGTWTDTLTPREAQCLRLVLDLHTNDAIARELDLSTNTVRNHVKSARDKLGGYGRYEAARRYVALAESTSHMRTSPGRIMANSVGEEADGPAARLPGGLEQSIFREACATYAHDDQAFDPFQSTEVGTVASTSVRLVRILAVPAGAALIALLIVATPPMAMSFEHLASAIVPFFK